MAASDGTLGKGTTLKDATPTEIAQIVDYDYGGKEDEMVEITNMDSDDDFVELIAGIKKQEPITFQIVYKKAQVTALETKFIAAVEAWTIELPDGSTFTGNGKISKVGVEIPYRNKITCSITLTPTGKWTFAAGV